MERFDVVPVREDRIANILKLAEEGGLSPWTEADYTAEIRRDDSIFLLLQEKESELPLGFIAMRLITNSADPPGSQAEILNITVHSDYRKLGLGSALLQYAIGAISEHTPATIWLEVRASNTGAIRFYEKHRFTREYVRKRFYSNPVEDGLVMKLEV